MTQISSAPAPGGGFFLEDLFLHNPILGLGLGAAGGAFAKGVAGLAAAGAVTGKINKLANVANAKIGLLNLKTNLVKTGLVGASLLGGNHLICFLQGIIFSYFSSFGRTRGINH